MAASKIDPYRFKRGLAVRTLASVRYAGLPKKIMLVGRTYHV
jgi:hypothetical protein